MKISLKGTSESSESKSQKSDPISFKPRPDTIALNDDEEEQEDISENVSNVSEDDDEEKAAPQKQKGAKQPAKVFSILSFIYLLSLLI